MVGLANCHLFVCFGYCAHCVENPPPSDRIVQSGALDRGLILPNSIFAIFPAVAQKELDKTYLTLHSLEILDPTPDSFSLSINSTISGASGIASHSHLEPMEISFYTANSDKVFMTLPLPAIDGGGDIPIIVSNATTKISDLSAFATFASMLLGNEELSFELKGRTTIHVGKLHTGVNYNEMIEMKGWSTAVWIEGSLFFSNVLPRITRFQ